MVDTGAFLDSIGHGVSRQIWPPYDAIGRVEIDRPPGNAESLISGIAGVSSSKLFFPQPQRMEGGLRAGLYGIGMSDAVGYSRNREAAPNFGPPYARRPLPPNPKGRFGGNMFSAGAR